MDHPLARAVPHVRNTAARQISVDTMESALNGNTRTALILLSVALVFFIGIVVRFWLW